MSAIGELNVTPVREGESLGRDREGDRGTPGVRWESGEPNVPVATVETDGHTIYGTLARIGRR